MEKETARRFKTVFGSRGNPSCLILRTEVFTQGARHDIHRHRSPRGDYQLLCRDHSKRKVVLRRRINCSQAKLIRSSLEESGEFQLVVEATVRYEWFLLWIEDLADRIVLAHPK